MQAVQKRIESLEKASPAASTEPLFIHLVGFGNEGAEIQRIRNGNKVWMRQPDELEQELKDRAISEVPPPKAGCSTVFLCYL